MYTKFLLVIPILVLVGAGCLDNLQEEYRSGYYKTPEGKCEKSGGIPIFASPWSGGRLVDCVYSPSK